MKKRKGKKRGRELTSVVFAAVLTAYTVFTLLDTFLIPKNVVKMADVTTATSSYAGSDAAGPDSNTQYENNNAQASDSELQSTESSGQTAESNGQTEESSSGVATLPFTGNTYSGATTQTDTAMEEASSGAGASGGETAFTGTTEGGTGEVTITDTSYIRDGLSIKITTQYVSGTMVYIADIVTDDPSVLTTALADGSFGRNITEKTSEIAAESGAILAVNGDYYGFRDTGYVMRNGYLYRSTARSGSGNEDLVIYADGTMEIIDESEVSAESLAANGAVQIFSFGPGLVENGAVTVGVNAEVDQSMTSNPRTAIGQIGEGHYVLVVSDGRTSESEGLTLYELAQVMQSLGCVTAYNLDGGGSTTMVFNGTIINKPTTSGNKIKERSVSDIVCVLG